MRIDGTSSSPALRLIRPTESVAPQRSVQPSQSVRPAAPVDSFHFDTVYISQLPRVPQTEAHQRLEKIRTQLVAGQVATPVYFNEAPAAVGNNPYKPRFTRFVGDPSEVNSAATQRAIAE